MNDLLIIDSHCHLDSLDYKTQHKSIDEVIEKAKARGVEHIVSVCTTLGRFEAMKQLTAHRNDVSLSCGVHPLNVDEEPFDYDKLFTFAQDRGRGRNGRRSRRADRLADGIFVV